MKVKMIMNDSQLELFESHGTILSDGYTARYMHYPFWIKQEGDSNEVEVMSFEDIPDGLRNMIAEERER